MWRGLNILATAAAEISILSVINDSGATAAAKASYVGLRSWSVAVSNCMKNKMKMFLSIINFKNVFLVWN